MSLDADVIVDRRQLRRKVSFWRMASVGIGVSSVLLTLWAAGLFEAMDHRTPHIARITIEGLLRQDRSRAESLDELAQAKAAKAVIVTINSPGGTVVGAEQLYNDLRRIADKKPIVAVVEGLAASGGYMAAISADHIVASQASLVGSIGVIMQYPNVGEALKSLGISVEEVKSSPLKAAPNGYEPTSPEARAALAALVKDSYDWFKGLVRERRHLDEQQTGTVADGRVHTGRQALEMKLVDSLGGERTALEWLGSERGINKDLPVRDWKLDQEKEDFGFFHLSLGSMMKWLGMDLWSQKTRLELDGLLALWHP